MTENVTSSVDATAPAVNRPEWDAAWQSSALYARVTAGFGEIPALLSTVLPTDGGVLAAPAHWHSAVYGDLVLRKVGTEFTAPDCYTALRAHGIAWDTGQVVDSLVGFLAHLKDSGQVTYQTGATGRPTGPIRVVADLGPLRPAAPAPAPARPAPTPEPAPQVLNPSPVPAPQAHAAHAPTGTRREPRSAAEATWLSETTDALTRQGLPEQTVDALLVIARWGTPVTVEDKSD